MADLQEILKIGTTPTDVVLNGELTPAQGRTFANAIIASDALLKKVTTDVTGKLTKNRTGLDVAKGMLTRHVSGTKAPDSNLKKLGVIGCTLDMTKGVELNTQINDDTLEDNKHNTKFESEQFATFNIAFSNDLLHLGMIGEDDNEAIDAPFNELAKGWVFIAADSDNTNKASSSNENILMRLKHLVKNAHDDVKGNAAIIMSSSDFMDYQFEIAEKYKDLATLLSADKKSFMQLPIETRPDIENGTYLLTPLKNMVFGISSKVKRNRWYDNDASALKYKFVVYPDYEFDIHKYVTYMTYVELEIASYETSVAVDATSQRTVQSAAGAGISGVTVVSKDPTVATVSYASATGVVSITGVAEGSTTVTVDDGTSTKEIAVTVTAA
jgi:hypothetical protein